MARKEISCKILKLQFLLFPQYFQKQSVVDVLKQVSMELRVKHPHHFKHKLHVC